MEMLRATLEPLIIKMGSGQFVWDVQKWTLLHHVDIINGPSPAQKPEHCLRLLDRPTATVFESLTHILCLEIHAGLPGLRAAAWCLSKGTQQPERPSDVQAFTQPFFPPTD